MVVSEPINMILSHLFGSVILPSLEEALGVGGETVYCTFTSMIWCCYIRLSSLRFGGLRALYTFTSQIPLPLQILQINEITLASQHTVINL
jgi:hypothetical protein